MADDASAGPGNTRSGMSHARKLAYLCIAITLISAPIAFWLLGPALPPGTGSFQDDNQVWVNRVILALVMPIYFCVVAGFIYSFVAFRRRDEQQGDPTPVPDDPRTQRYWIVATAAVAVFLWAFGTYEWIWAGVGSGGGQGPVPLVRPERTDLEVQVIGQQWAFTYRYPSYGGMESPHLVLPEGQTIEMHVTSLDVIHSFWAYQLGVKADANPGVDNVAYVTPTRAGPFDVRCAELCGIWHGYMFDQGEVVSASEFEGWIATQQSFFEPVARYLPRYSETYLPDPARRGG